MLISPVLIDLLIERANEQLAKNEFGVILKKENAFSMVRGAKSQLHSSTFIELMTFIIQSTQFDPVKFICYVNQLDARRVFNLIVEQLFRWEDTVEGWEFWYELYMFTMDSSKPGPYWKSFSQADYLEIILTGDLPIDKMRATME